MEEAVRASSRSNHVAGHAHDCQDAHDPVTWGSVGVAGLHDTWEPHEEHPPDADETRQSANGFLRIPKEIAKGSDDKMAATIKSELYHQSMRFIVERW
jgi:hypothetical protein